MTALDNLRTFLHAHDPGTVTDVTLYPLLANAWVELAGSNDYAMATHKLDRIEDPTWAPPILAVIIERYGGTVQGPSRAELQEWRIDVDAVTAQASVGKGFRQLTPNAARLDLKAIIEELTHAVRAGREDPRLVWNSDGSVTIRAGVIIPERGPKATVAGRRKRLRAALRLALEQEGWRETGANRYTCSDVDR